MSIAWRVSWISDHNFLVVGYSFFATPPAAHKFIEDFYRPPKRSPGKLRDYVFSPQSDRYCLAHFGELAHPRHGSVWVATPIGFDSSQRIMGSRFVQGFMCEQTDIQELQTLSKKLFTEDSAAVTIVKPSEGMSKGPAQKKQLRLERILWNAAHRCPLIGSPQIVPYKDSKAYKCPDTPWVPKRAASPMHPAARDRAANPGSYHRPYLISETRLENL